ncbi:MAG TPA: NAD-dependent epimerase/dehydratase family protein [Thermoanaerobaculia bacterium]|nr:NAD-dependent epimerase/dehydratase family protein [Thermoanaerobaculia bacterium]
MSELCLITGATGALGPSVVGAFLTRGYRVRTFSRHPAPSGLFDPSVEVLQGDILDGDAARRAVGEARIVVHLAALLHIFDPPDSLRDTYHRVNVEGTRTIVRASEEAGVRRIVFCSTISVYGDSQSAVLTEGLPPSPDTWYAKTKFEAEKIVLDARDHQGHPIGTVLRLSAVYGGRIKGNYFRLVQSLDRRRFVRLGAARNRRALVYDKDVGRAVVLAGEHPAAAGEIFNVSDGAAPTLAQIIDNICSALGRPSPRFSVPLKPVAWVIGAANSIATRLGLALPVTPAILAKYEHDLVVDSGKLRDRLGFVPSYDQTLGWRDAVAEMRANGWLR